MYVLTSVYFANVISPIAVNWFNPILHAWSKLLALIAFSESYWQRKLFSWSQFVLDTSEFPVGVIMESAGWWMYGVEEELFFRPSWAARLEWFSNNNSSGSHYVICCWTICTHNLQCNVNFAFPIDLRVLCRQLSLIQAQFKDREGGGC